MRFPIYEYLYQLNRNLHETVEILEHIRKSPGIDKKQFHAYQVEIEHLRAEASQHVADTMDQIEAKESAQLWKQKRAYEKSLGDPDDVYFEVRNREEERRKQGLPSLIGVLRGHIREPGDEEIDQEIDDEVDGEPEKTTSHVSRPTRKVRPQPRQSKRSGQSTRS
jgi:regulator of replication initiation timing